MTVHRKQCSATLSGSLIPATHQPLRLIFLSSPASAKRLTAFKTALPLLSGDFFLFRDFITKNSCGVCHVERKSVDGHGDRQLQVQILADDIPDPFLL